MLAYVILGASYGFAAAVQPGQFQAYLLSETMTNGWRRTLPAVFAPVLSDIPVVTLVLLVLVQVPPLFLDGLRVAGGLFLLYLAYGALTATREFRRAVTAPAPAHQAVLKAALVNLLNPNPYIAWAFILGPLVLQAWRQAPINGVSLVSAFYVTMVVFCAAFVMLLAATRSLGARVARVLVGVSAVALAAFGLYQLGVGTAALIKE